MEEKLRILLCEDDENLGTLTREYLEDKGYKADLMPDGEAGYKAFLKGKYDICLLDVMMPKKDGFQLAQEIRMVNTDVPIIFLTAKTMKDDILEGFTHRGHSASRQGEEGKRCDCLSHWQVHIRHTATSAVH